MRDIVFSNNAKKDIKKLRSGNKFNMKQFIEALDILARGDELPSNYADHKMSKSSRPEYMGCRDFHLKSNICVIYVLTDDEVFVKRVGSHQDLNLTESKEESTKNRSAFN